MNHISFIRQCFKSIKTTGTIIRSSRQLCKKMIGEIDFDNTLNIIELGAGDGVITAHILDKMRPDASLLIFEINEEFCKILHKIEDDRLVVVQDSAEHIGKYMEEHAMPHVDVVISALPFVMLPNELSDRIIRNCYNALKDGGIFVQMHYSLVLKNMYKKIFKSVQINFVPINLPPAYVLRMTK